MTSLRISEMGCHGPPKIWLGVGGVLVGLYTIEPVVHIQEQAPTYLFDFT